MGGDHGGCDWLIGTWTAKSASAVIFGNPAVSDDGASQEYVLAKRWREQGDHERRTKSSTAITPRRQDRPGYRGYGLPISDLISEGMSA